MIIRCPQCEHSRSISEGKIPPTAELATCPKCKHRFRFRTLPRAPEAEEAPMPERAAGASFAASGKAAAKTDGKSFGDGAAAPRPEVIRPQEAFRESAEQNDIWDAVDALHQRWEKQMDQHVVEVEQPGRRYLEAERTAASVAAPVAALVAGYGAGSDADPGAGFAAVPAVERATVTASKSRGSDEAGQGGNAPPAVTQKAAPLSHPAAVQAPVQVPVQAPEAPARVPAPAPEPAPVQADVRESAMPVPQTGAISAEALAVMLPLLNEAQPFSRAQTEAAREGASPTAFPSEAGARPSAPRPSPPRPTPSSAPPAAPEASSAGAASKPTAPRLRIVAPLPEDEDDFFSAPLPAHEAAPPSSVAEVPAPPKPRFPYGPDGPYGEDGPDPEARVEKDMEMLRETSAARPLRDLGRLREYPDAPVDEDEQFLLLAAPGEGIGDAVASEDTGIPWETPGTGRFAALAATVRGVMFGGPVFFTRFRGEGSLVPGYLFFLIMGYLCILCGILWSAAVQALLPGLLPSPPGGAALPALLLLAPAALGLMQLFVTGWIRIFLRLLAPEKADFGLIYKVVSYSVAPFVLSAVPFAGPVLGAAWFMAALASGCRGALGLSLPLSLLLPLPPAALLVAALLWFFL